MGLFKQMVVEDWDEITRVLDKARAGDARSLELLSRHADEIGHERLCGSEVKCFCLRGDICKLLGKTIN